MITITYIEKTGEIIGMQANDSNMLVLEKGEGRIQVPIDTVIPAEPYITKELKIGDKGAPPEYPSVFCYEDCCWKPHPDYPIDDTPEYIMNREMAYPPIGDQLDAVYKLAKSLQGTMEFPPDVLKWIADIDQVKDKFKKE